MTTALGFACKGFNVIGYDIDLNRSNKIKNGIIPFFEPGIEEALKQTLNINFFIVENEDEAARKANVIFLCVGTPCKEDGNADLQYLNSAIDKILLSISCNCIIVIKSTIPPGTTSKYIIPYILSKKSDVHIANNPEFLREGYCWNDFMNPDRIVCGCDENDDHSATLLTELYKPFNAPIHFVSHNTAEFIKYLSNSLLASLISFSNEMALIAQASGDINIGKAFKILHEDKRLNGSGINHYIYPGCGYGGYCLPKDTVALSANSKANGFIPKILDNVISLNSNMPRLIADKIKMFAGNKSENIGILGLSFKPDSDDVRDSPAAKIINCLLDDGYCNIFAYDPIALDNFRETYSFNIKYSSSKEYVLSKCIYIAIVTTWSEFKDINKIYPEKHFIDCRYYL